jgi:hypothetical protein
MNPNLLQDEKISYRPVYFAYLSFVVLASVWVIMQALLFYRFGLVTGFEAEKYINEANYFLTNGTVSTSNYWLYSVQIFLIAAALKLKTGLLSVAFVQLLFNAWATWSFYKFITGISNRQTAITITLLLILNYPLQTFNTSLQTESLFYSFTILFSCFLLRLKGLTARNLTKVILFLLLISFTRPTGVLLVPCSFLYLFFRFFRPFSMFVKSMITIAVSICFLFFLNAALGSGGGLDFMLPFRDERIICGVPTLPGFIDIKTTDNPNSIIGLLYYITHNPGQFMRLALLRSKAFFGLTRSYYSLSHNFYLCVYFYPLYLFVILSWRSWFKKNKFLLLYCVSVIAINWLTVILTCDDWHNRFFLSITPYIYILAIPALQKLTGKLNIDGKKQIAQSRSLSDTNHTRS